MKKEPNKPSNRIREWRKRRGLSLQKLADILGEVSWSQLGRLETGKRRLDTEWLDKISKALNCSPLDLVYDEQKKITPVGIIGERAAVFPMAEEQANQYSLQDKETGAYLHATTNVSALIVKGDSMAPTMQDGWTVYYGAKHTGDLTEYINKLCVLKIREGETLVRTLKKGYSKNKYNLLSSNAGIAEDVEIEWCAKIIFIKPS